MRHLVPCRDGVFFDCEIRDKGFYKFGSITITEISETEVKTQFLEGRSEQNFDKTFDKVYINELNLGTPATTYKSGITPANVGVSRNLVGINFRHPNVMPNFAVWKTITYRHWHRWCCQPRF